MGKDDVNCANCGAGIYAFFHSPVRGKYFCSNCFKSEAKEREKEYINKIV
jgi:hypothetical protein